MENPIINIIDKREFRKRRKELFSQYGQLLQKIIEIPFENKISWGAAIEESTKK